MRILVAVLFLGIAFQAWSECGKLCHYDWWKNATLTDLQAELNAGADVTARGDFDGPRDTFTPLHWAAQASIPENIQALVAAGADVMALADGDVTPLHFAAQHTPENIQALVAAGANVMAKTDNGTTPLHLAADYGTPAVIQALLDAGADVMARDKAGKTPWDLAQTTLELKGTDAYTALGKATCGSGYWFKNLVGLCG